MGLTLALTPVPAFNVSDQVHEVRPDPWGIRPINVGLLSGCGGTPDSEKFRQQLMSFLQRFPSLRLVF